METVPNQSRPVQIIGICGNVVVLAYKKLNKLLEKRQLRKGLEIVTSCHVVFYYFNISANHINSDVELM